MVKKSYITELASVFLLPEDGAEMLKFLKDILTPQELVSLAERWQIVKQLSEGGSHREIAANLNTSVVKVTRGSRAIKYGNGGFKSIFKKVGIPMKMRDK